MSESDPLPLSPKQLEEALRDSEERHRIIAETASDAIITTNAESRILFVNSSAERIFGYDRAEMLGQHVSMLMPESLRDVHAAGLQRHLDTGEKHIGWKAVELPGRHKSGREIPLEISFGESVQNGKPIFTGIVRDITKRKRAEAERQVMSEIIHGVNSTPNLDELLRLIHQALKKVVSAENCRVGLYDRAKDVFAYPYYADQFESVPPPQKLGKSFAAYVFRTGQPLRLTKQVFDEYTTRGEVERSVRPAQSWVGVPLRTHSEIIGVLVLLHYEDECAYTDRDLEFLASVGDQVALAIERKRAEDTLRRSEASFRLLFAHNPMPTWVFDTETLKFLQVNEAAVSHYGYSPEEFLNMLITDICPPEDVPAVEELLQKDWLAVETPGQWRHRTKGGQVIDVEMISHRLEFGDRKAALVVAQDITERQRVQEALRLSEANYRSLVLDAPYGICRVTGEGKLLDVNPALVEMLGYGCESELRAVNLELDVFREPAERNRLFDQHPERLDGAEVIWKRKDGTPITVRLSRRPLADGSGPKTTYELIAENVTEQRALENKFRQAQRMEAVGRLAGGIAHDFNNLLMVIKGHLDLLRGEFGAGDPKSRKIEQVQKAADRAAALTRQLLAFSRMQVLHPRIINLNGVVGEIGKLLPPLLGENIDLAMVLDPSLGCVKADPGQIEQVILNLAVNARDAMPKGGRLAVETSNVELDEDYARAHPPLTTGHYVMLVVSDTGTGMDPETQAHIFEPFFTTKERGKGTGLGLATVYGIVKQSGGFIWVYSEPGHGATFRIYLPLAMAPAETVTPVDKSDTPPVGTETILIAEDENGVREVAREFLTMSGYNVLEAKDGAEAMEIVKRYPGPIHLLVTDRMMPGMSGPELAAKVLALQSEIKVIYMSGYSEFTAYPKGELDPDAVALQKPFTRDALVRSVRDVLDGRAKPNGGEDARLTVES